MPDLISQIQLQNFWWAPLIALVMGLIGAPHCLGMCGGIVLMNSETKRQIWSYHLGRLLGYLTVVALLSTLGIAVIKPLLPSAKWLSGIFLSLVFILMGMKLIGLKLPPLIPQRLGRSLHQKSLKLKAKTLRAFLSGALTIFLPCGLSYSLFFALLALGSPGLSLLTTFTFWMGTVPALLWGPRFVRRLSGLLNHRLQKFAGVAIIIFGLYSVYGRIKIPVISPPAQGQEAPSCH